MIFTNMPFERARSFISAKAISSTKVNTILLVWINIMARYLSWPLLIFSIFGVIKSLMDRKKLFLCLTFFILLIFFTYGIAVGRLPKNDELSLSLTTLLIPIAVYGLYESFLKIKRYKNSIVLIFIAPLLLYLLRINLSLANRYPDYLNKIALYLRYNSDSKTKILLNNYKYQSNHIPIIVGKNTERFKISGRGGDFLIKKEDIMGYIVNEKPRYIVYSDEGKLPLLFTEKYLLNLDSNIKLRFVFEAGPYKLYEVNYI
jgi:hypothetical protein